MSTLNLSQRYTVGEILDILKVCPICYTKLNNYIDSWDYNRIDCGAKFSHYKTHFYINLYPTSYNDYIRVVINLSPASIIYTAQSKLYFQPELASGEKYQPAYILKELTSISSQEISDLYHTYKLLI